MLPDGYRPLVDALAAPLHVRYQSIVERIEYDVIEVRGREFSLSPPHKGE